jgi:hypothetical protein
MKEIVSRINSFLVFDVVSDTQTIRESFLTLHRSYQEAFPHWSLQATRKKVISQFWFRKALQHFVVIMMVSGAGLLLFYRQWTFPLTAVFLATFISFIVLLMFNYAPTFYNNFLPILDTIIYEQERFINAADESKKCKRTQFSIPTLTVIIYVFAKMSNMPLPAANDRSAELLNRLYGADKDKLKQNLSRLYKIAGLSPKERAEMLKGIESSRGFFEGLDALPAQKILDQLEFKLQKAQL